MKPATDLRQSGATDDFDCGWSISGSIAWLSLKAGDARQPRPKPFLRGLEVDLQHHDASPAS